jgi:ethanolamine permease
VLAFGVVILTAGVGDPRKLATIDYPLLAALGSVLGAEHGLTRLFAGIGLFGLIASFNGIIIAYSRQIFALARSGYLPAWLARVSPRRQVPHTALIAGGLFGVAALCAGRTDQLVILSVLGAVVMYICSLITLFVLRRREPNLARPYAVPFYPWCPLIALALSGLALGAIVYYNPRLSALFFGMLGLAVAVFVVARKARGVTAAAAADIA